MARKIQELPKEIIQSYLVTSARYDFSVYEKRILYRIVELLQAELKGQPIGRGIAIEPTLFNDRWITMPLGRFLKDEEDKNHAQIKKAFERLGRFWLTKEDEYTIEGYAIIKHYKLDKGNSFIRFEIAGSLYDDLMDFAKGYTQYELQVAFNFRSQYTMRFYELISRNKLSSIIYSIGELRKMFCLENRYKLIADFLRKVIEPARKELKASKAPWYFTYEPVKTGRAFTHIKFSAHYRPEFDGSVKKKTSLRWDVSGEFLDILNRALDTGNQTWKPHRELLAKAEKIEPGEIQKILHKAPQARNPVGYVIGAFKRQVQAKGTGEESL